MDSERIHDIESSILQFIKWLDSYGETSYDHQSFFAGPIGKRAKSLYYNKPLLGIIAVSPMIFSEAFFPSARRLFWKRQRLPIADAHYAMGFSQLAKKTGKTEYLDRAKHFLDVLGQTRCPGYQHHAWGYPFDWVTRGGIIRKETPLITTTPYVFEAYSSVYELDDDPQLLKIMRSIADHVLHDYNDFTYQEGALTCSYTPLGDSGGVINASAYRAFTLASAAAYLEDEQYWKVGSKNLNFVLSTQREDGSWPYAVDNVRDFVDHFHTCFVIKALAKIDKLNNHQGCTAAIEHGVHYYLTSLFDQDGMPKPFSKAPRLTVYRNELYDIAECLNLGFLLRGKFEQLDSRVDQIISNVLNQWQKYNGSFRSRKLLFGWDNVPMHRWAQSQIFRSLSLFVPEQSHVYSMT